MPLFAYFWIAMFAAAMMPATSYASTQPISPSPKAIVQAEASPVRAAPSRRRGPPKVAPTTPVRDMLTLGWADEDEVPIF